MSKIVEVATKGFIVRGEKFLVIEQMIGSHIYTDLPGGKMEYGLTPEENLRKEIKEEIGLEIDNSKFIGTSHFFRSTNGNQVVCLLFICQPKSQEIDLTKNTDTEENIIHSGWMTPEDFMKIEGYNKSFLETTKKVVNDYFIKKNMPI